MTKHSIPLVPSFVLLGCVIGGALVVNTPGMATILLASLFGILALQMPSATRSGLVLLGLKGPTRNHVILFAYLVLVGAAFLPILEGYNPLREGLTARRAYEFGLLVMATGVAAVYALSRGLPRLDFPKSEIYILLAFALLGLASASWSPAPLLTLGKASQLLLIVLGVTSLVPLFRKNSRLLGDLPYLVGLSSLTLVGTFLLLNYSIWGIPLASVVTSQGATRLVLGYAHPLMVGNLASLGVVSLMISNRRLGPRLILMMPLLWMVWLTSSRGPAVGLVAAGVVLTLFHLRSARRTRLQFVLAGVFSIWLLIAVRDFIPVDATAGLIKQLRLESVAGLSGRLDLWRFALEQVQERPLLGIGYETGRYVLLRYAAFAGVAHNSFIEVLIGTGFLGFTLLVVFSVELWRTIRWTRDPFLAGLATYAYVYGLTNPIVFVPGIGMTLLTLAIIRAVLLKRAHSPPFERLAWGT